MTAQDAEYERLDGYRFCPIAQDVISWEEGQEQGCGWCEDPYAPHRPLFLGPAQIDGSACDHGPRAACEKCVPNDPIWPAHNDGSTAPEEVVVTAHDADAGTLSVRHNDGGGR